MIQGLVPVASASQLEADEQKTREAASAAAQRSVVMTSLASHVRSRWSTAKEAKVDVEKRLLTCIRQRNGEYDPAKLAEIRKQGGSEIFMHLTSTKCRAASSWLRDTLMGKGAEKPWTLSPTPLPELPTEVTQGIKTRLQQELMASIQQGGSVPTPDELKQLAKHAKDLAARELDDEARKRAEKMEKKMEDQLLEGRASDAMDAFIDDIVTFPTAIMKGPVLRKRAKLQWQQGEMVPITEVRPEWERVDPFMIYPAPWATSPHDGFLIERHKLSRRDLDDLIGVDGYSESAIRSVLSDFDTGGLREWVSIDTEKAEAVGNDTGHARDTDLIDALQLWDDIQGKLLREWGMDATDVPDEDRVYACEVWLVGNTVIRAVLNYDKLDRKPYYATSYEKVPGTFWGHGVADLVRDAQNMCNAAARALNNNMGIASGPQVGVNISRLPANEDITQMYPWKIWQFTHSDYGDNSAPFTFFQPNSNAQELMAVYEHFSRMADEYSGIPRYMTGEHTPGAGRTASGLSMMIQNAGKAIKQVISNVDNSVIQPLLERLYHHNMRYSEDVELKGDVEIVARGAMSLVAKEAAAVRRTEFLQLALNSPVAQQIVGMAGIAELLRESAKALDMNVDKVVPSREHIEQMQQQALMQQQAMMDAEALQPDGSPQGGRHQNQMVNHVDK